MESSLCRLHEGEATDGGRMRLPRRGPSVVRLLRSLGAISVGALLVVTIVADPVSAGATTRVHADPTRYPFAGYLTSPTTITSAAATMVVPSFTCTRKVSAMTGDAIVYDSNGPSFGSAMVYLGCSGRKELVSALTNIDDVLSVPTVIMKPGDTVALSATCGASGIALSIDDTTTASVGTASSSNPETCTQAEVGDDAATNGKVIVPLPAFGSLTFTDAMVNGAALGSLTPTANTLYEGKKNVVTTGALTDGGTAFTTTQGS